MPVMSGKAIVAHGPLNAGKWTMESVTPRALEADEVLVHMVATGICLADVHFGNVADPPQDADSPIYYPRILGHEGVGYIHEVGSSVTTVKPNDPVVLSYASCGTCYSCVDDHPAYCSTMFQLNFVAQRGMYKLSGSDDLTVGASFFGQSSFAHMAVVKQRCVVNLRGHVRNEAELKVLAPLGCGVQTGTAAMIKVANIKSGQDVVVIGAGSVGLSAIMAAHMVGCRRIIAIDRTSSRLRLAESLGATHTIDTSDDVDIVATILIITDGNGTHVSLDTTGVHALARSSYDFIRNQGKIVQVGLAKESDKWDIPMVDLMNSGKQILGCAQGDAIPQSYILEMIEWHKAGKLPIEKIIRFYDAEDFERALHDMRLGSTIKPVLVWSQSRLQTNSPNL